MSVDERPILASHHVDVWLAEADENAVGRLDDLLATLPAAERFAVEATGNEAARRRAAVARAASCDVVGQILGLPSWQVELWRDKWGKPRLTGPSSGVRFNVSHSGGVVLVAVAHGREVGVDVEHVGDRHADCMRLATRFFSPGETGRLERLPPPERERAFFELWVAKEAHGKAVGKGLSVGLDKTVVRHSAGRLSEIRALDGTAARRWSLRGLDLGNDYVAAVVAEGGGWVPRVLRWPDDRDQVRATPSGSIGTFEPGHRAPASRHAPLNSAPVASFPGL